MVDLTLTDGLILAGVGSAIATGLTLFANWLLKRREESIEMSKIKMASVVSTLPTYGLLAGTFSGLYFESIKRKDKQNQDTRLIFYYICDILRLDRIIYYDNGGLILNNRDGEYIISAFEYVLYSTLFKKFDKEGISKMRLLTENKIAFHEFCNKIKNSENRELYKEFIEWHKSLKEEDLTCLENKCKWINELLFFELNTVFSRWYKRKPRFKDDLSDDLQKYLLKTHEQDTTLTNDPKKPEVFKRYCKKINKMF